VSPPGWKRLAEAAERTAPEMNPQGVANTLNALMLGEIRITFNLHAVSSGNASDSNNVSVSRPMC